MPDQQPQPTPDHPLHSILGDLQRRMQALREAKGYTAEHAKHEFRDDLYPMVHELCEFVGELDDRIAMIEAEESGGLDPALSEEIIEGLVRFGACLDLFAKYIPAESDDGRALAEHRAWYAENVPGLIEDTRAAVEPDEGAPEAPDGEGADGPHA